MSYPQRFSAETRVYTHIGVDKKTENIVMKIL